MFTNVNSWGVRAGGGEQGAGSWERSLGAYTFDGVGNVVLKITIDDPL
ncbi:hypothetical protein Cha6605_2515 [Chamaesiphon minutus PCC 6605]|uniref:Uncharacterized protein n=1 Tax=Chamaesiphon minutus (strain ATCC 27169 / PCC 6605) TaxID=1173020 RepID=K9UH80_CHAP6|nr:hypothetical protein Cha6605_2515 [Chamaesiphon minutus PCC 6605]